MLASQKQSKEPLGITPAHMRRKKYGAPLHSSVRVSMFRIETNQFEEKIALFIMDIKSPNDGDEW
jgi:hypothetical protein